MNGPAIERLLHRLAETPAAFLAEPRLARGGSVVVEAVVFDVLADLGKVATAAEIAPFTTREPSARNWLRLVLIASWLVHDESLRERSIAAGVLEWLTDGLGDLAAAVDAEQFVRDADRREELARLLLAALNLPPDGETPEQAADRLSTVDSVQRARLLAETEAKRRRAEQLRKEMAEKRAREAAARYSRE